MGKGPRALLIAWTVQGVRGHCQSVRFVCQSDPRLSDTLQLPPPPISSSTHPQTHLCGGDEGIRSTFYCRVAQSAAAPWTVNVSLVVDVEQHECRRGVFVELACCLLRRVNQRSLRSIITEAAILRTRLRLVSLLTTISSTVQRAQLGMTDRSAKRTNLNRGRAPASPAVCVCARCLLLAARARWVVFRMPFFWRLRPKSIASMTRSTNTGTLLERAQVGEQLQSSMQRRSTMALCARRRSRAPRPRGQAAQRPCQSPR